MIVVGSMIGSGIFIVSADIARNRFDGRPAARLDYHRPDDGRRRAFLRRARRHDAQGRRAIHLPARGVLSALGISLYGWTLFLVIQTGTIAAVAVGFRALSGRLWPAISPDRLDRFSDSRSPKNMRSAFPCSNWWRCS
jgi:APA family basic amino acid/polyamine antiporter